MMIYYLDLAAAGPKGSGDSKFLRRASAVGQEEEGSDYRILEYRVALTVGYGRNMFYSHQEWRFCGLGAGRAAE